MRKRLKVLVVAQYFPPDMGGGSTRAYNVVNGLLGKGCEVTFFGSLDAADIRRGASYSDERRFGCNSFCADWVFSCCQRL